MSDTSSADTGDRAEAAPDRVQLRTAVGQTLTAAGYGSVLVLSHEAAERVFTEKRRQIVSLLDEETIDSQRALARRLDRDAGAVHRDLQALGEAGVIELREDGRKKRPVLAHDTILVEPLAAPESVTPDEPTYTVGPEP